jgi:integrase
VPSVQRGVVDKPGKSWRARWYDENGQRCSRAGFATKSAARAFADSKTDEVLAVRRGDPVPTRRKSVTVADLVDEFLRVREANPDSDPATTRKLRAQLKHARSTMVDCLVDELRRPELEAWRFGLPAGSRHDVFRAFRQVLAWGIEQELTTRNPALGIRNPKRKRHERRPIVPFETWEQVDSVVEELDPRYAAIPVVLVGTGLRPEEMFGLERRDVDREAGVLHVRRRFTQGVLKQGGKTDGSTRAVPLRQRVRDALEAMPPRIDSPLLFPAPRGGYIDLEKFRHREWAPALRAAGIEHRRVYDCRHTFATWAIEDGRLSLIRLAKMMGTSVRELEDTYFRWLDRGDEQVRSILDDYDGRAVV